jgi:radical SAM protein with 4Fe4S-binding SPASM domain
MMITRRRHFGLMTRARQTGYILIAALTAPETLPVRLDNLSLCVNLDQCNLRCIMCWQTYSRDANRQIYPTTLMSRDNLLALIRSHWLKNTTFSVVGGGESFLYPYINDLLVEAPTAQRRLMIMTNGSLLHTNPVLWQVAEKAALTLMFSVDAATPATYEQIRKGGSWSALVQNIERAVGLRSVNPLLRVSASFVVLKQNLPELMDFMRLNAAWGSEYVHIHPAIQGGFPDEWLVDKHSPEYQELIAQAVAFARQNAIAIDRLAELLPPQQGAAGIIPENSAAGGGKIRSDDPRRGCNLHNRSMTVSHSGDVYLCDTAFRVHYRCGNVFAQSLPKVWLSPEWLSVRLAHQRQRQHLHPLCSRCLLVHG